MLGWRGEPKGASGLTAGTNGDNMSGSCNRRLDNWSVQRLDAWNNPLRHMQAPRRLIMIIFQPSASVAVFV
jgi:hypothetical protein